MRFFKFNLKSLAVAVSMISLSFGMQSCVDNQYDLNNISTEVTVGGEEVILPLATIEPISLSQMLGGGFDGLDEENGAYVLKFEGEGQSFSIDGISLPTLSNLAPKIEAVTFSAPALPSDFIFSEVETSFVLGYPDLNVAPTFEPIKFDSPINLGFNLPSTGGATIPSMGERQFSNEGEITFPSSFSIPEQIRSIGKIFFGNNNGSPINIALEFKGLKSINGGGKLNLNVVFPESYSLVDMNGRSIGNTLKIENYEVAANVESVEIGAYLQSIDFSHNTAARGTMNINDKITYSFDYTFNSVSGYVNTSNMPQFSFNIAPKFRDMEIVLNQVTIDNENHTSDVIYTLTGIPESISSIDYIAFDSAPITMRIEGLSWLKTDALTAETQLPECFIFEEDANGYLNTSTNKMKTPMRQLEKGVTLNLKAIDLSKINAQPQSGQLNIATSISSHISDLEGGQTFLLSEVLPPTKTVNVKTIIDESHFYIDLKNCLVEMKEQYFDFELSENQLPRLEHTITVPDELASIERLELKSPDGNPMKIRLGISHPDGEVFPVDKVYLSLTVNFKKMIHPVAGQKNIEQTPNGDYILHIDNKEWRPNDNPVMDVVEIEVDAIENLPEITGPKGNRQIVINEKFAVTGGISIDEGTNVNLEAQNTKLNFDFAINDAQVSKFYGKIDYSLEPDNLPELEIGELAAQGLKIDNLDISPIIRFNINNPIDVPFNVTLELNPYDANGKYMESNQVKIEDVHIEGEGQTKLILSTEERRSQFENEEGITFVEANLSKLFKGSLPAKIAVKLKVASDLSTTHVIDLTKPSYEIGYDYSVSIPLEFGHDFDISYEQTIDLGGVLTDESRTTPVEDSESSSDTSLLNILDMFEVGEVSLLADFTTTIPLDFILETECLDKDGNPATAQISFGENSNMIHGHHPEDAEPEAHSTLELKLNLGEEGNLNALNEIAALRLRLNLRNNSHTSSALSPDQTLSGKLRLKVKDGLTINLRGE